MKQHIPNAPPAFGLASTGTATCTTGTRYKLDERVAKFELVHRSDQVTSLVGVIGHRNIRWADDAPSADGLAKAPDEHSARVISNQLMDLIVPALN